MVTEIDSVYSRLVFKVHGAGQEIYYYNLAHSVVVSRRLGYLKAISIGCWQTVSTSEVFSSYVFSSLNYSVVLKSN